MKRREFLKVAGAASAVSLARGVGAAPAPVFIISIDDRDPIASAGPVRWAAEQLRAAIAAKGALCRIVSLREKIQGDQLRSAAFFVFVDAAALPATNTLHAGDLSIGPECFALMPGSVKRTHTAGVTASGSDVRGYVYALLELAERVQFGADPRTALSAVQAGLAKPANEIRCVSRYFCSELEDKTWLYDKDFWPGYLDVLAASRFNRFCLAFGLEYDFPKGVTSDYLHFPYPYLVDVPGYDVRVMQLAAPDGKVLATPVSLSAAEREKNLEALHFIAAQTAARGLHFQLGIWTHAYQWTDSPNAYHRIEGTDAGDACGLLPRCAGDAAEAVPGDQGLTLRVHGESGIPEGSYGFWETLFAAVKGCGRTIEIDMHAKGVDEKMIDIAVATGMPVKLGAKYSAEHQSLGYQQADIRALEIPKPGHAGEGPFSLSSGCALVYALRLRGFSQGRQPLQAALSPVAGNAAALLLSADPEMAAAYGRTAHFCGAVGLDLMEPLTFKGREGSGQPGGRCAYADATLESQIRLAKVRALLSRVGPQALRSGCGSRGVAPLDACGLWRGRGADGDGRGPGQPDASAGDLGAFALGIESLVLAGDQHQHADRDGQRALALQRHAGAEVLWHGEPARSADFFDGRRARRRFTGRQRESQVFADRRGAVAGGFGGSGERCAGCGAAGKRGAPFCLSSGAWKRMC